MFPSLRAPRLIPSTLVMLAAAVGGTGIASAQDSPDKENPSGPYIAFGFGQFDVQVDNLDAAGDTLQDLDADDAAYKLAFGWRFNPYLSLEGAYVDLGAPRGKFEASGDSGQYEFDLAGFGAYVIGSLPLGIFELSAKVGYYFHDIDVQVDFDNVGSGNGNVVENNASGEALVYGVGAGVTLFEHLNAKIEYELLDIDEVDDANVLWLTTAWRF